jgi:hypothetical protein
VYSSSCGADDAGSASLASRRSQSPPMKTENRAMAMVCWSSGGEAEKMLPCAPACLLLRSVEAAGIAMSRDGAVIMDMNGNALILRW